MRASEQIEALATALAAAQGEIGAAIKGNVNPAFGSKYADLGAVIEAARPALVHHGLAVVQMPEHSDDALVHLTTRILHSSGQWLEASMSIPVGKPSAHGYGSAITYARRYAFAAAIGVVADDDDDCNKAAEPATPAARIAAANHTAARTASDEFAALPAEAQQAVREWAMEVIAAVEGGAIDTARAFVAAHCDTPEDKLALWSQLPAGVRSALKKADREKAA